MTFSEALSRINLYHPTATRQQVTTTKLVDPTFERLIKQAGSENLAVALSSIGKLNKIASSIGKLITSCEDDFMKTITIQLRILHPQDPVADRDVDKVYRIILSALNTFYKNKYGKTVSVATLKTLMDQLITLLVEEKWNSVPSSGSYIRMIHLHCVRIMEKSDHTNIICALVQLIHEYIDQDRSPRHVELVTRCLWKVIRLMPSWGDDIDYDIVLVDVHNFLKKFPTSWWKSKDIDTPLKIIKTLVHSSTKMKGATILLHLGKIPNTSESEVESYILRVLKSLKINCKPEPTRKSLSRENHNKLTEIFQKIGTKDETEEGIQLLYDFLQQHPEADIEPFLRKSSKFFQDYIKNGLKKIEDGRKTAKSAIVEKVEDKPSTSLDMSIYRKKLDDIKKTFGALALQTNV